MHEMAIAQGILDIALAQAVEHQGEKIHLVHVQIGAMTGIEPQCLLVAFEALAAGTLAAQATLEIEAVPLTSCCRDCQHMFSPAAISFTCPACGSAAVEIITGRELRVVHLEVD
jgi:hydrogenase nickel incorporation protein HypA/HybF